MRRDYFDATVRNLDDEQSVPVLAIAFDGPSGGLAEGLRTAALVAAAVALGAGAVLARTDRLTTAADATDPDGVLSVSNRLTGEFVLEANLAPDAVDSLVRAVKARNADDETRYRVRLTDADGKSTVYDKGTLLVYDAAGSLLRGKSLIPNGVEL